VGLSGARRDRNEVERTFPLRIMDFLGTTELSLDAKFRLTVPVRYRAGFTDRGGMVLTVHPDGCLLAYPKNTWDEIAAKLLALPSLNKASREWQRLMIGHAEPVEIDSAGRILIAPQLRKLARLDTRAAFVGQGNRCEIWSLAAWEKEIESALVTASTNTPPGTENFTL
jgi:MraZ protein